MSRGKKQPVSGVGYPTGTVRLKLRVKTDVDWDFLCDRCARAYRQRPLGEPTCPCGGSILPNWLLTRRGGPTRRSPLAVAGDQLSLGLDEAAGD
jgi:hypothetical protein